MKNNKITAVLAALLLLLGLAACGQAAPAAAVAAPEAAETITVSATGSVRLVPDKAAVNFSVSTQETSAALAQSKNSEAVRQVMETLTGRGIDEKSIRTTSYNMYPQYDYSDGSERIIGYVVRTSLSIQDQELDRVGELLADCVAAGVNGVDSVTFLCSGYDEAYRQALALAVEASREKAAALAGAAGKSLGEPVSITEGWQDSSARYGRSVEVPAKEAADAMGASFQPGETEISANVTATYRMG